MGLCSAQGLKVLSIFCTGFKALFLEAKEIRKIKINMAHQGISFQQLPYRDMERLRQVGPASEVLQYL